MELCSTATPTDEISPPERPQGMAPVGYRAWTMLLLTDPSITPGCSTPLNRQHSKTRQTMDSMHTLRLRLCHSPSHSHARTPSAPAGSPLDSRLSSTLAFTWARTPVLSQAHWPRPLDRPLSPPCSLLLGTHGKPLPPAQCAPDTSCSHDHSRPPTPSSSLTGQQLIAPLRRLHSPPLLLLLLAHGGTLESLASLPLLPSLLLRRLHGLGR